MADWVDITDAQVDPDAPLTSELAYAWRDNVVAMTEGAVGAPRIQLAALASGFVTAGGVGSYVFAARTSDAAFGADVAGSSLTPTGAIHSIAFDAGVAVSRVLAVGSALSGTWKAMGRHTYENGGGGGPSTVYGATLWLRIA